MKKRRWLICSFWGLVNMLIYIFTHETDFILIGNMWITAAIITYE